MAEFKQNEIYFGYRKSKKSTIFTALHIFFLMKRAVRAYYI